MALLQQGVAALLLLVALIAGGVRAGAWLQQPTGERSSAPAGASAPPAHFAAGRVLTLAGLS